MCVIIFHAKLAETVSFNSWIKQRENTNNTDINTVGFEKLFPINFPVNFAIRYILSNLLIL